MTVVSNRKYKYVDAENNNEEAEAVVREYEARYEPKRKVKNSDYQFDTPSAEERKWAMLAHLSAWLVLVSGALSLGAAVPLTIFIPLLIYFNFRERSDYVARHALQAFALQVIGTVGVVVLMTVGSIVWTIGILVSVLLMLVLVGFLILPLWVIAGVLFFLFTATLPITMLVFASFAAANTHNGGDYRYPIIARWIERRRQRQTDALFV